ncbi:unnamed protein product, partial [Rotaria sp. Silwood1]
MTVDDNIFWNGLEPLTLTNDVPRLQESITVVGFPIGGDNLSVTKGVVSRVVMSTYTHSLEFLLTIQIDAATNPGNSGGPAIQEHANSEMFVLMPNIKLSVFGYLMSV